MKVTAIKTKKFLPPQDDLFALLKEGFSRFEPKEKSIIVVTSKIVAIWQGRCVEAKPSINKDDLIKKEADYYIDRDQVPNQYVILTIKNNVMIPSAGIDESNANGYFILWPNEPFRAAEEIRQFIKKTYRLKQVGVIISDSHTTPLRSGVSGIGLAYAGFHPLRDYRGKKDIFGRTLRLSQSSLVDAFAAAAVVEMGEGNEQKPVAVIEDIGWVKFGNIADEKLLIMDRSIDIYAPIINSARWKKSASRNSTPV